MLTEGARGGIANGEPGVIASLLTTPPRVAVIAGATDAAKAAGWDVKVIDTQASADQAEAVAGSKPDARLTAPENHRHHLFLAAKDSISLIA